MYILSLFFLPSPQCMIKWVFPETKNSCQNPIVRYRPDLSRYKARISLKSRDRLWVTRVLHHYFRDFNIKRGGWERWSFIHSGSEGEIHHSKRILVRQKNSHDVSTYICVCAYIVYVCVYICVCVYVCLYCTMILFYSTICLKWKQVKIPRWVLPMMWLLLLIKTNKQNLKNTLGKTIGVRKRCVDRLQPER